MASGFITIYLGQMAIVPTEYYLKPSIFSATDADKEAKEPRGSLESGLRKKSKPSRN
jgi:hypothetical protein